uniref:Uncharacterized protein n=1 Tax=Neosartorya fischeri (strain ATCC 1020 / DSM 3700 / CBS 544.65 / FGSC A1164 / JCM 1740 / NRRL 181 / WB 181) TaxID=331117 RepID=H9CNQ3_NEOFI|nr:hypothetical protein NFIA_m0450 [Aspergillus fischeri]
MLQAVKMLQAAKIIGLCLTSPPKPHAFASLPLQSATDPMSGLITTIKVKQNEILKVQKEINAESEYFYKKLDHLSDWCDANGATLTLTFKHSVNGSVKILGNDISQYEPENYIAKNPELIFKDKFIGYIDENTGEKSIKEISTNFEKDQISDVADKLYETGQNLDYLKKLLQQINENLTNIDVEHALVTEPSIDQCAEVINIINQLISCM